MSLAYFINICGNFGSSSAILFVRFIMPKICAELNVVCNEKQGGQGRWHMLAIDRGDRYSFVFLFLCRSLVFLF
jgi:hypothetical protein